MKNHSFQTYFAASSYCPLPKYISDEIDLAFPNLFDADSASFDFEGNELNPLDPKPEGAGFDLVAFTSLWPIPVTTGSCGGAVEGSNPNPNFLNSGTGGSVDAVKARSSFL